MAVIRRVGDERGSFSARFTMCSLPLPFTPPGRRLPSMYLGAVSLPFWHGLFPLHHAVTKLLRGWCDRNATPPGARCDQTTREDASGRRTHHFVEDPPFMLDTYDTYVKLVLGWANRQASKTGWAGWLEGPERGACLALG